ncbi:hypothetical protein BLA23254_02911 [Burkholderia lata]|uniref:NACHT domain-containing protein n=1 Tax=Burkholderia lata (strain ATCC 17760 / DSM 23089 / LMG 22485 / NCIMB 9086 / R18194 / 383) TaxID=482957 RepID=A0A6P2L3I0_BURL3|nr:hypothetical protein [Burkholderia lata]VWB62803.1 hypothetical protein BLA23254_02911 [Burkholderia lata]
MAELADRQYQFDWLSLLAHRLVVVLGEPGSGESEELRCQHRRNPNSFFPRFAQRVTEDVETIMSDRDLSSFRTWKSSSQSTLFLLDAVDESKLKRDDDFLVALDWLSGALASARERARLVVSSRIRKWWPQTDCRAVLQRFSVPSDGDRPTTAAAKILVETIFPLRSRQGRLSEESKGVRGAQDFLDALDQHNACPFPPHDNAINRVFDSFGKDALLAREWSLLA